MPNDISSPKPTLPPLPSPHLPLRVALVGCGRVSIRHIDALCHPTIAPTTTLVGVCDLISSRAEAARDRYVNQLPYHHPPDTFDSLPAMLATTHPDLLVVATPSGLHVEHALCGLSYDTHLLVEKPLSVDLASARTLTATAATADKHLFGVMQNRCHPTFRTVKSMISGNDLGNLYLATLNLFWNRSDYYYAQDQWRGCKKMDGGLLFNQGIHYIDLLQWFVGPLTPTFAQAQRFARHIDTDDAIVAMMKGANGCLVSMCATILNEPSNYEVSLTLVGSRGTIQLGGPTGTDVRYCSTPTPPDFCTPCGGEEMAQAWGTGHTGIYTNLLTTLHGTSTPVAGPQELLETLALVCDLYDLSDLLTT